MLEALGDRPKGTPQEQIESQYKELFLEGIRTKFADTQVMGRMQDLMRKAREMKDVTIGTSAAGGFAVPKEIGAAIDKLILSQSEIASNVKNIQVGTSDYQELVSFNGAASGWVGETGTRSATGTPSLRNIKPTWGELYAYPQISEWSAQDIFFDVAGWLIGEVSDNMSVDLSTSLFSGDGSDQLTGMTNTAPVATGDNDSPLRAAAAYEFIGNSGSPVTELRSDDIIDLAYKLKAGYRSGSKWAMNSNTQGAVRKLKDTTGQYLWQPSLQLGQPDMLLGYPMFTWEDLGEADVANALPIAFGNWERGYLLTRRSEMMITVDQVTNPGYIRYYVRRRWGGMPKNNDAIKFLKNA
jgi:HK97 family phage major capsid protein